MLPIPLQVIGAVLLLAVLVTSALGLWLWAVGAGLAFVLLPLPWMAWRRLIDALYGDASRPGSRSPG